MLGLTDFTRMFSAYRLDFGNLGYPLGKLCHTNRHTNGWHQIPKRPPKEHSSINSGNSLLQLYFHRSMQYCWIAPTISRGSGYEHDNTSIRSRFFVSFSTGWRLSNSQLATLSCEAPLISNGQPQPQIARVWLDNLICTCSTLRHILTRRKGPHK